MAGLGEGIVAEADGAIVGAGLRWHYGTSAASLGLIGVSEAMRGIGLGRKLTQALLIGLDGRTTVLHATQAGQPLYESLGFVADGWVRQHQGVADMTELGRLTVDESLCEVGASHLALLTDLDMAATGFHRNSLLAGLLGVCRGVMLNRGGAIVGFALTRPFGRGAVIGPVVAPDKAGAQLMIDHELALCGNTFVRIDAPEGAGLSDWLLARGLAAGGRGTHMVRGIPCACSPLGPHSYAVASQAWA